MTEDCIFCRIVKGKIPCAKIFENKRVFAFMDIQPAAKGHVLVIPKTHAETLLDIEEEDLKGVISAVKKTVKAVVEETNAEGFNILQSNKKIAGQVVPHLHFHIIPRRQGDGQSFAWKHTETSREEIAETAKRIRERL